MCILREMSFLTMKQEANCNILILKELFILMVSDLFQVL